jgi:hypothetical protein
MLRAKLQDTLGDAQIKASDICSKVAEYLEAIQAAYAAKQKLVDEARKDFDAISGYHQSILTLTHQSRGKTMS